MLTNQYDNWELEVQINSILTSKFNVFGNLLDLLTSFLQRLQWHSSCTINQQILTLHGLVHVLKKVVRIRLTFTIPHEE